MSDSRKEARAPYYSDRTAHMLGSGWKMGHPLALCGAMTCDCEVFEDVDCFERLPAERKCRKCERVMDKAEQATAGITGTAQAARQQPPKPVARRHHTPATRLRWRMAQ